MASITSTTTHLINPEPITVKGIKTFNPTIFCIYTGKNGKMPLFKAVEEKRGGTAIGAIFKKTTQLATEKKWMGKVGNPRGILRNNPDSIRTRNKKELNLDTIREKLAYDFFQELGRGFFLVPKTRLSLQPIRDRFNKTNILANAWVEDGITESLRIMSSYLEGYNDFAQAFTMDEEVKVNFMQYLIKHHRPPESILTPEGDCVPLYGVLALLAVGRCLADVDLLGGAGRNAGFVWVRNEIEIVAARTVKIDPGYAFCFTHNDPQNASENFVINTENKLGSTRYHLEDLKDIQTSTGNHDAIVHWNSLKERQQDEFLSTLLNSARYLQSKEVLDLLCYRERLLDYPDANYSNIAYMPKELADQMQEEMKIWISWQLEIYDIPLSEFRCKYPEQALRIHYIDSCGELFVPMQKETFPIRELFTELVIVDGKERKSTKMLSPYLPETDSFKESIDRLDLFSNTIALENLFEEKRRVLLIGRAGIGKSTLCQKIAHDWASGKLWNDLFEAVYWLPLRNLNDLKVEDDPHEFLASAFPHLFENVATLESLFEQIHTKKILLILDGYDEANPELMHMVEILLKETPFHILLTSRPGKIESLEIDQTIENIGFSDKQIKTYINKFSKRHAKKFIQEERGHDLFTMIKNHPNLYPIAHIPLQLQMIVSLYEKTEAIAGTSSLTKLYQLMTEELYHWYLRGQKSDEKEIILKTHGEIALIGLAAGELVISHKKIQVLLNDTLLEAGILKKIEGAKNCYQFIHLTFQEYLAALYISRKSSEKQNSFILENRHKPSYQLVLAFLAGLNSSDPKKVQQFFATLYQKSNTMALLTPYLLELTLRCLNECEGFEEEIPAIDAFAQENPQAWDEPLSDGYSPFLSTAFQNQTQALKWLGNQYPHLLQKMEKNPKNPWMDGDGKTAFSLCVQTGNVKAMEFLLQADPLLISKYMDFGWTPLHEAAFFGHIKAMELLLQADPLLISKYGGGSDWTPLHAAAFNGHVEAMRFLLEVDPLLISKCMNSEEETALHTAASNGQVEAMQFLFQIDPLLLSKNTNCWDFTPLHFAAYSRHRQVEAGKWLYNKDPTLLNLPDKRGKTPLMIAIRRGHSEFAEWLKSVGGIGWINKPTGPTAITEEEAGTCSIL